MNIEKIYMFDNNFYAFLLLGILLFVVIKKEDIYDFSRRLFYTMIVFNMLVLLVEVFAWAFDGIVTPTAFFLNYLFNVLLIIFEPIMAALWLSYVDYKIYNSRKRLRNRLYYLHASFFAGILLIINIFEPIAFSIDENNIYHRGDYLWLSLFFVLLLVLYTIVLSIVNRKKISDGMIAFIAVFALLPVLVSFIQLFVYGLILTWAVVALGVVFAYYLLEIAGNSTDYLTKLKSRRKIEEVIRGLIENKSLFTAIMIDLEYFKDINDSYGLQMGDKVLQHFAIALRSVFPKNSFISRIGGDEFMIVIKNEPCNAVATYKAALDQYLLDYQNLENLNSLTYSIGCNTYEDYSYINVDEVFNEVDKLMYSNKSKNKNKKRRLTD